MQDVYHYFQVPELLSMAKKMSTKKILCFVMVENICIKIYSSFYTVIIMLI